MSVVILPPFVSSATPRVDAEGRGFEQHFTKLPVYRPCLTPAASNEKCASYFGIPWYASHLLTGLDFPSFFRCCSNALNHLHWLCKNVCTVLFVSAQDTYLLPTQFHHDNAVCWTDEVNGWTFPAGCLKYNVTIYVCLHDPFCPQKRLESTVSANCFEPFRI